MSFCSNCGKELKENAKFCFECGTPVPQTVSASEKLDCKTEIKSDNQTICKGEIHKCQYCGEILQSFETVCPACQNEVRGVKSSNAVKTLSEKLEQAVSEQQRIVIIKNFPIPNTKEDIFEFMLLASSNFDAKHYAMDRDEEDISDAWLTKIKQCYHKAKLSFGNSSDFEKIEAIYIKVKNEQTAKEVEQEELDTVQSFKKSKMRICIILFAIISAVCCFVAFISNRALAGIIAIIMVALFVLAYLLGSNVIKEKKKNLRLIPTILAFILFIPYLTLYSCEIKSNESGEKNEVEIEWDNFVLGENLPDFGVSKAEVVWDTDKTLVLYFYNVETSKFDSYIEECKDFGYNIDKEDSGANFTAYNAEGYYLRLHYSDLGEKRVTIDLEVPKNKDIITWPSSALVKDVPVPKHLIGEVSTENEKSYSVYLVGVEKSYFTEYVALCMENGFNIDYSKSTTYFRGENSDGISITVEYEGFNTLYIWVENY